MNIATALVLLVFAVSAQAEDYKCVENGKITYTNIPCQTQPQPIAKHSEENKTAAQIQADFEQEKALKEQEKKRLENIIETTRVAQKEAIERASNQPSVPVSKPIDKNPSFDWGLFFFLVALDFIPGIIASSRGHHNSKSIWALTILLGWTLLGWIVALVWALSSTPVVELKQAEQPASPPPENKPDPEIERLTGEVVKAVKEHAEAFDLLMLLSRFDGTMTQAEKIIIFDFLKRQVTGINQNHHHPYMAYCDEWYVPGTDEVINTLLTSINSRSIRYRLEVVAAATAIVAVGGTPKRREAELLEKIRSIIPE